MADQKKILIGITGGIAAYKAAEVCSRLTKESLHIRVVMTDAATRFVGPLTFAALTQQKVLTSIFPDTGSGDRDVIYPHLYPATEADLFIIVPATADSIAKIAHGMGDDIVCCSALSLKQTCIRIICPAMNVQMWENQTVQDNVAILKKRGWKIIGPETGKLACGTEGAGRMSEPNSIVQEVLQALS